MDGKISFANQFSPPPSWEIFFLPWTKIGFQGVFLPQVIKMHGTFHSMPSTIFHDGTMKKSNAPAPDYYVRG